MLKVSAKELFLVFFKEPFSATVPQKQAEELLSCSDLKEPARFFFFFLSTWQWMLSKGIIWPRISDLSSCRAELIAGGEGQQLMVRASQGRASLLGTTKRGNKILKMPRFEAWRGNVRRQVCGRAALQL